MESAMNTSVELITVRFARPVEGVDPHDGEVFIANRHRVAAAFAHRVGRETVFVNDHGEIVARWATRLIHEVRGAGTEAAEKHPPSVGTLEWRQDVQERHPRAYQRWSDEEDAQLREEFSAGLAIDTTAAAHARRPGAIVARLVRLGLVDPEAPEPPVPSPEGLAGPTPGTPGGSAAPAPQALPNVDDDLCRHEQPLGRCSICKHDGRRPVFLSAGGAAFHAVRDCPALLEGQRLIEAGGGIAAPIETVHRGSSRLEGRFPCLVCRPE